MGNWRDKGARAYNTTVINLYPLNTKMAQGGQASDHKQRGTNYDNNLPIQSAHPGGAHVALADGSVQFLQAGMEFQIYKLLAIRDSGQVKAWTSP